MGRFPGTNRHVIPAHAGQVRVWRVTRITLASLNLGNEHGQNDKIRNLSGDNGIYTYPLSGGLTLSAKLKDLPIEERIRVVEDLWDSIAADQKALPLTAEQKAELDRRSMLTEVDKNRGRLATDAVADIWRKL